MLKVVGASWLQTRISTYILVAVALLGVGAIILGEYGRAKNDGTYSATVWWKHRSGYRIDFWGQGNDLESLPRGVARGYYKTGIYETGWSTIEIETSSEYPDDVQAYAAGLLEGSLTWQLIYHHWHNTVRPVCVSRAALCYKMRQYLRQNAASAREKAALLRAEDPYWHMVHLYYEQLNGLAEGWRFAVQRRGQDAEIKPDDFLWMALAPDLPDLELAGNGSRPHAAADGMLVLKAIEHGPRGPLVGLAHNTATPYARMLRLFKRYKFAYHLSPAGGASAAPGQAVAMSSYPGALSSQDESYLVEGPRGELLLAGTPLAAAEPRLWGGRLQAEDRLLSAARLMAANRLATDGLAWAQLLERQAAAGGAAGRQWLAVEPRYGRVRLVEQLPAGPTQHSDRSVEFARQGFLGLAGAPLSEAARGPPGARAAAAAARAAQLALLQANVSSVEALRELMRGPGDAALAQLLAYRGDLAAVPRPHGVVDSKLFLFDLSGVLAFEGRCGPPRRPHAPAFDWAASFPNSSHLGQPEVFAFDSFAPRWVWL
ncbi:putative phospholipase B-like lamina ancestor [Phymastichus coffea]|uniref:putative phospholipase B-like lamina ancestor n=1 Tax=Phymastichus coffea TaxID=108790 RepID=UPI00273C4F2D|nr:putative phospholipase B-like lamina ancestor [Phymastichus coffea]XP_058796939.1 putative phospholipase B-like lamina ancestor [Phymastichus coffea]